ncbi:hypothetical protein AMS68_000120 [Peltaster fructicola]|uniref:Protein kinase domain-containing protein n=1 Tax=Peltaster fructicola TaxID=286661 RepID=A0A6H0XIP9_9PEZI|nr:hypothetical protein AMS68_000120 [Peltaster fructicola]
MAAYDIHRHFKSLRADTGRRRGRPDPFATGFEDEVDNSKKQSKKKPSPVGTPTAALANSTITNNENHTNHNRKTSSDEKRRSASPYVRVVDDSDDDNFLSYRPKSSIERRASPASLPLHTPSLAGHKSARALAVGNLAYLDDSSEEEEDLTTNSRSDRRPSPAPRKRTPALESPPLRAGRSLTPSGTRERSNSSIPRHTVASAFAGTKYLQDSDSDEDAISSQRSGSQDSTTDASKDPTDSLTPLYSPNLPRDVKRVDKPKSPGSGVSWRAFSAGRTEQRNSELQNLRASLQKRGKSISFVSHVVTDDGQRIPLGQCCSEEKRLRGRNRERSPPRTEKDVEPSTDEIVEQPQFTENPFSGSSDNRIDDAPPLIPIPSHHPRSLIPSEDLAVPEDSLTLESQNQSPMHDSPAQSPIDPLVSSIDLSQLSVGPQTIPESRRVDHSLDQVSPPYPQPLSRASSTGRFRAMMSANSFSRRTSRRSTSNVSSSPAHAFLASWTRGNDGDGEQEVKPDDEGQAIGINGEYIIGRTINQGGFGVVKEIRTRNEKTGQEESLAVKIVRKQVVSDDAANERTQQDLEHEVSIWRHLQHRHILELRAVFETEYATFCVMDLNVGGTLHEIVRKQREVSREQGGRVKGLDSKLAKHYAYQLASALRYLHEDIQVCHRDVKLENCLVDITTGGPGGNLRLCDFGLADFLHSRSIDEERDFVVGSSTQSSSGRSLRVNTTSSIIGTLEYASPKGLQAHRKLFETAGDVWAYGVIVYALCTGELPFRSAMPSKTIDSILRADWDQNALRQASTSGDGEEVYEMVSGCLRKSLDERWTITDCIGSFWFESAREDEEAAQTQAQWR